MTTDRPPRLTVTHGMADATLRSLSAESLEALLKAAVRGGTIYDVERVCLEMERRNGGTPCE